MTPTLPRLEQASPQAPAARSRSSASMADRWLQQFKDAIKASLHGGMLFEELGFRYFGPIDGHDLPTLRSCLEKVKAMDGPGPAARPDRQGARRRAGREGPGQVPHPAAVREGRATAIIPLKTSAARKAYTDAVSAALYAGDAARPEGRRDHRRDVPGEQAREGPRRLPRPLLRRRHLREPRRRLRRRAWPRPAPGRSSTSTPRSCSARSTRSSRKSRCRTCRSSSRLDRAGLIGADGPTHHGSFDIAYMRLFPNMVVMAPGDELDVAPDARLRPRATTRPVVDPLPQGEPRDDRARGRSRSSWARPRSSSGRPTACSSPAARCSPTCVQGGRAAARATGLRVGVINARFVKPLDRDDDPARRRGVRLRRHGRGRLPRRAASARRCSKRPTPPASTPRHVRRLGLPDRFVVHAERDEQLAEVGLDVDGITRAAARPGPRRRPRGRPRPSRGRPGRRH